MPPTLRVIFIADVEDDALLIEAQLRRGGYAPTFARVENAAELARVLDTADWDLVIADFALSKFSALEALALLAQRSIDLPFIVISDQVGEEAATAVMKAGAHDCFRRRHLELLGAAVQRELREVAYRRECRLAETRIREAEVRYRTLFEQSPEGVLLVDPETHVAVEFNDRVCETLGYTRNEFQRLRVEDYDAAESPAEVSRHLQELASDGRVEFETRHRDKNGRIHDVLVSAQGVTLAERRLVHAIVRDVTSLRQGERLLREGELRYWQLLSSVSNYTYTVWCEGGAPIHTEHSAGCQAVTGYTPDDYSADPYLWIKMVHPSDREAVRQHVERVLAGEDVEPLEHRIIHRNGGVRWVRDGFVERRTNDGRLISYDGVVEDITARRVVEHELRERDAQLLAARRIQERLLPAKPPDVPGFDIAGAWFPSQYAAGDYFDFLPMLDGALAVVIADVAGHRFPSALLMASTRAYLRSLAQIHTSPAEILSLANSVLAAEVEEGHFVTLFLARLNPRTRSFTYASAGHPTGFVFDASGEIKTRLESTGLPLAVAADAEYPSGNSLTLVSGDVVLLLTDGVHDARSPGDEPFGMQRCLEVVRSARALPAAQIAERIHQALKTFCNNARMVDDVTIVILKAV